MADPLSAALEYAAAGLYVFPARVVFDGGHKQVRPVKAWREASTRDERQIREWFGPERPWAGASLCVDCGRSGIVVVDLDVSAEKDGVLAWSQLDLEQTPLSYTTPGGGLHLWYREHRRRVVGIDSSGKVGHGIDVRGLGGFVIVAPSEDARGAYGPLDVAELEALPTVPELVIERMTAVASISRMLGEIAAERQATTPTPASSTGVALTLDQGFTTEQAVAFLRPHWQAFRELRTPQDHGFNAKLNALACMYSHFVPEFWSAAAVERHLIGLAVHNRSVEWQGEDAVLATIRSGLRQQSDPWRAVRVDAPAQLDADESEWAAEGDRPRKLSLTRASAFNPGRVRWGWAGRMPVGELTLVPGREGVGKSLFLAWMAARLTKGELEGEFYGRPRAVLYAASEDSWRYTIAPRMIAAGADLDLVYRVTVESTETGAARLMLPIDCGLLPDAAEEVDAAALMLDPIVSHVDDKLSVNQSRELRQALEPLRDAAERAGIMVPALVHFNKAVDTDVLSKIPGGRAWAEVARAAFALARNDETDELVGSQIKNNLGRLDQPNLTYTIDEIEIQTLDGPTGVGRFVWTGESDTGVSEVLGRRPERRGRPVSENTAALVGFVQALPSAASIGEIRSHFPQIELTTARRALDRAVERGEIARPGTSLYGPIEP